MGENFRKRQAANYQAQRDSATAVLEAPALFNRQEIVETLYTIEPDEGQQLKLGERLHVAPAPDSDLLIAVRGHRRVGAVMGESALLLRAALADGGRARVVDVFVVHVQPISGVARARLIKDI